MHNAHHPQAEQDGAPRTDGGPLVTVVVPVFNHDKYVGETLDSLIAQTYPNLELVAIDDGSSDRSFAVMQEARERCERRFSRTTLVTQKNAGVAATLNRGIAAATGEYVFLLASDDLAERHAIATLVQELQGQPTVGLACGDASYIDAGGRPISAKREGKQFQSFVRFHIEGRSDFDLSRDFGTYRSFLGGNYMPGGLLMRRDLLLKVGSYDTDYALEDYALYMKLSKCCRFRFVNETLTHYRIHHANSLLQLKDRLLFDGLRLAFREAEYCFSQGLGEPWRQWATTTLQQYSKVRSARQSKRFMRRAKDEVGRFVGRMVRLARRRDMASP